MLNMLTFYSNSNIHKSQSNIAIHSQIDNKTVLSYLLNVGAYPQQRTLVHQQVHLEIPSQQTNCTVCILPSQCFECTCRLRVKKRQGQFKVETKSFSFSRDCNTHGTINSKSLHPILPSISTIHCIETIQEQYSKRCIPASLGQGRQFHFFSIQLANSDLVYTTYKSKQKRYKQIQRKNQPPAETRSQRLAEWKVYGKVC